MAADAVALPASEPCGTLLFPRSLWAGNQVHDDLDQPFVSLLLPHHLTRPDSTYNSIPTGAVAKW